MPNKTFVHIFIGLLQEMSKKIFLNHMAMLDIPIIATLKRKLRDGNILDITEYI